MQLRPLARMAVWIAALGLLARSAPAAAQDAGAPLRPHSAPLIIDVRLSSAGELKGSVVDAQGLALAGVDVTVAQSGQVVARTLSDADGTFRTAALRGGVYQVAAAGGAIAVRAWDAQSAPPAATSAALIVGDGDVVRGRLKHGRLIFSDAFLITGVVVAAIAIPVGILNARNVPNLSPSGGGGGPLDQPSGS